MPPSAMCDVDNGAQNDAQDPVLKAELPHTVENIGSFRTENGKIFYAPSATAWTNIIPRTEHNQIFFDSNHLYAATSLGPISDWSPALRMYVSMVFADSRAACVFWGPEMIGIYNEKYAACCGSAHPFLMGRPYKAAFPTLAEQVMPMFDRIVATSQAVELDNIQLYPLKEGLYQEMYFVAHLDPLRGSTGEIEGFYNTYTDYTSTVLHDRRRRVVNRIAAIAPHSVEETLSLIVDALRENPNDITMAMIYAFDESVENGGEDVRRCASLGIPEGHQSAPLAASLSHGEAGVIPLLRKVHQSKKLLVLQNVSGDGKAGVEEIFHGVSWAGHAEPAQHVVIVPLLNGNTTLGFFVQGTNARRPYDEATEMSIIDATRQMEAKWVASQSLERARVREQMLEQRATDYETRLRNMARSAPLGMLQIDPNEKIEWANNQYYEITGHDRANPNIAGFFDLITAEEIPKAQNILQLMMEGSSYSVREYRLKRKWRPPVAADDEDLEQIHAWILAHSFPIVEDGKVTTVLGYIADISHQKWAEGVQTRNAAAATLARRRQEEFIDTTSHEMRNPLTAIIQLADGISRSLQGDLTDTAETFRRIAEENVDASNTILACAAHQKRVIDDVLILSRLESQMLSITPVVESISNIVDATIKMFRGEVLLNGTEIEAARDTNAMKIDHVLVDSSRLRQVLINLISNAIKFTSNQPVRRVSVVYGVQSERPPRITSAYGELKWVTSKTPKISHNALPPLKSGEDRIYLYFCIQDTGTGMTDEEMKRLFKRFSQATKKTHIAYGGSGLGLYICRELVEKQGGAVGVASSSGEGAVFGFYIETRAVEASDDALVGEVLTPQHSSRGSTPSPLKKSLPPASDRPIVPKRSARSTLPCRLLLVEDNLVNQKVLAKQLRSGNYSVTVANHGAEALEILEHAGHCAKTDDSTDTDDQCDIDVVLMDWEMPVMNGLDCCTEIRRREERYRRKRLPVIAITANVRQQQMDQAMAAGMDRVLPKPFTVHDLTEKIDELLAHAKSNTADHK